MKCPYCDEEMLKGIISGDGRECVDWKTGDKRANLVDKFLGKVGVIDAVDYTLHKFTIEAYYCVTCKKIIIDTEILL